MVYTGEAVRVYVRLAVDASLNHVFIPVGNRKGGFQWDQAVWRCGFAAMTRGQQAMYHIDFSLWTI